MNFNIKSLEDKIKDFVLLVHWRNPFIASAGTEKYIQIQVDTLKQSNVDSIVVFPVRKKICCTIFGWGVLVNKQFWGVYDEGRVIRLLQEVLKKTTCKGVIVHHLMWSDLTSLKNILSYTPEIIFYVHDYYSCCEQQNLMKNDECYCGDGGLHEKKCKDCKYFKTAESKKKATKQFFAAFERLTVIAPSETAANIWKQGYPEYSNCVKIIEHLTVNLKQRDNNETSRVKIQRDVLNVAFVGQGIKSKGWDIWSEALKELPEDVQAKYNFYHLGFAPKEYPYIRHMRVSIADDGPDAMIDALNKYEIDVAVLLSVVPETYSYTFFEALQSDCLIISTIKSGNIKNLVLKYQNGILINDNKEDFKNLLINYKELFSRLNIKPKVDVAICHNDEYLGLLKKINSRVLENKSIGYLSYLEANILNLLYKVRYFNYLFRKGYENEKLSYLKMDKEEK